MQRKVTEFARRARRARGADVALAFFAGHGVQAPDPLGSAQPVNYLLTIEVDIKDAADLGFLLSSRDIVARLQSADGIRILILDACRDNPIPQRLASGRGGALPRGLGRGAKASGTLIAFSTQPDETADDGTGRNSPFMTALLSHIAEPGLDVRLLFADVRRDVMAASRGAQRPETWDSLDRRFAFEAPPQQPPFIETKPAVTSPPQVAVVAPPSTKPLQRFSLKLSQPLRRHARACRGHPRLAFWRAAAKKDVDGRDKPGHDVERRC
jgi:uncharacterized caspase-like protein